MSRRCSWRIEFPFSKTARSAATAAVHAIASPMSTTNLSQDFMLERHLLWRSLHSNRGATQYLLNCGSDPVLVVRQSDRPAPAAQLQRRIPHNKWPSGKGKHFHIIIVVTDGHDLFAGNAAIIGPALECVPLRTSSIEDVDDREIARWIFRAQDRSLFSQATGGQSGQCLTHARESAAEHGLHRVRSQRSVDRNNKIDV